ncbi:MAG TPA: NADP-dependent oxidoreductase, partial [Casimicrobiaceae bacterium]|nr:NADP-dependent oxidoreductase [Casimicrobiaceae bacterium]
ATAGVDVGGFIRCLSRGHGWGAVSFNGLDRLTAMVSRAHELSLAVRLDQPIRLAELPARRDDVRADLDGDVRGISLGEKQQLIERLNQDYYLGMLGMPGITAWFGLTEVGKPKAGETLVVSAASGAVGSVVGQLARLMGCRVVGIAGGKAKCDYVVQELGFDVCVDHRASDVGERLREACPKGIDVDFENVGGALLDTLLGMMNLSSRIVICGLVAEYNATEPYGYKRLRSILVNRIRMQGMLVFDWADRYGEAIEALSGYLAAGRLKYRESIVEGIDNAPRGLIGLLKGENFGKQLVKLD